MAVPMSRLTLAACLVAVFGLFAAASTSTAGPPSAATATATYVGGLPVGGRILQIGPFGPDQERVSIASPGFERDDPDVLPTARFAEAHVRDVAVGADVEAALCTDYLEGPEELDACTAYLGFVGDSQVLALPTDWQTLYVWIYLRGGSTPTAGSVSATFYESDPFAEGPEA